MYHIPTLPNKIESDKIIKGIKIQDARRRLACVLLCASLYRIQQEKRHVSCMQCTHNFQAISKKQRIQSV
jgi:hypothetical protein